VHDLDEAVRRANASSVGLSASVWTRDRKKGHAIAARLESGAVMINDHMMSHGLAETPWGGFKESSLGRTHGAYGLEGMTQPRVVVDDIMPGVKKNMWWYPHDRAVYEGHVGGIEFLYGKGWKRRFEGLVRLVKTFLRTFRVD
jgi:succinate-semialdehyde dehydrogenase/glutarate-semialdehyde dehydrogenase